MHDSFAQSRSWFTPILFIVFLLLTVAACGGSSGDSASESVVTPTPVTPTPTTPTNSAPTGNIIIVGELTLGASLSIDNSLTDANGLGEFTYQWLRTNTSETRLIANENSAGYTVSVDDVGFRLSVTVSYVDQDNFSETITSNLTEIIVDDTEPDDNTNNPTNPQPNILLIIADDQGIDASAQYPYSTDVPQTPTLNQLANEGIVFDNVWATAACTTTRGTLITGQHGVNSGIDYVPAAMNSSTQTLQRYLTALPASADYQTAVIGKWHLGGGGNSSLTHPTDSGIGYYAGNIAGVIDDYYNWPLTTNGESEQVNEYHTSKVTNLAIDWISQQSDGVNHSEKPWFMWLAYVAPHSPFHLPPNDLHSRDHLTGTADDIDTNTREYYLAAIEAMDTEIGRLLSSMSEAELSNTLILYIGDNGTPAKVIDASVFQKSHSKGSLYEGGVRVPMIASGKGVTRTNVRESALVNTTDFYASIVNFAGNDITQIENSYSFIDLLTTSGTGIRTYNYTEFISNNVTGWASRNQDFKLIQYENGEQALFDLSASIDETNNILATHSDIANELSLQAHIIRGETATTSTDITNAIFTNRSVDCFSYINQYYSDVFDVNNSQLFMGDLTITVAEGKCIFQTNNIPNHDFNDGARAFPNDVSEQSKLFEITTLPSHAETVTGLSLTVDNAILLNGVKVDLLAAGCFGVGNGKVGCNDINQPWRYDPMFSANGFLVDSHNAHSQPDGSYHYHGTPNAFYHEDSTDNASPVIGFAADGYPIFGPYFDDNGTIRKAQSSFQLRTGERPSGPGGNYDGAFRDDYQYIEGAGDLDECNGMMHNGTYGYYITDVFPYVLACFKGTPDNTFRK